MFFFSGLLRNRNKNKIDSPLRVHASHRRRYQYTKKRTSQSASLEGTMTIEAAVVLPLLLCVFVGIIMWGKIFVFCQEMDGALLETAREVGRKEYLFTSKEEEGSGIYMAVPLFEKLKSQGDFSDTVTLDSFYFSKLEYLEESGEIYLAIQYRVKLPLLLLGTWKVTFKSAVKQKTWTGYKPSKSETIGEGGYVYITEDGEVYHKDSQCYHLHVTVQEVYNVDDYYDGETSLDACEYCVSGEGHESKLYITPEGDCYHEDISCSGLTRRVKVVSAQESAGRRACKECCK